MIFKQKCSWQLNLYGQNVISRFYIYPYTENDQFAHSNFELEGLIEEVEVYLVVMVTYNI